MERTERRGARGGLGEPLTSFVGRRPEIDGVRCAMEKSRLVTLVGAGGVGKTRLAIEVGRQLEHQFEDGVWFVDLGSVARTDRLAQVLLSSLDVRDESQMDADDLLDAHLAARTSLIVLDNCEHLVENCAPLVDRLLETAPGLRVLATSREALGLSGEHMYVVDPLGVPDPEHASTPSQLLEFDAVRLLVERARAVRQDFSVDEDNAVAVSKICELVDGIPLAIELTAIRLRSLSVRELVARFDRRFDLLSIGKRDSQPRQQTLRALIEWSFDLCTADEQLLWERISIFPGSFDLAAAQDVCADDGMSARDVVDGIDRLVAKSILTIGSRSDQLRYSMLVTMREYAAARLDPPTEAILRRRHREQYLRRGHSMVADWCGPGQVAAVCAMRDDHPNVRAALRWSLDTPGETKAAAIMVASLRYQWVVGGFLGEGRNWLDQTLAALHAPSRERADVLWVSAWVALLQEDAPAARTYLVECAHLALELDDELLGYHANTWSGTDALFDGRPSEAAERLTHAAEGLERLGHVSSALTARFQQSVSLAYAGDPARAVSVAEDALAVSRAKNERWGRGYLLWALGIARWRNGELQAAWDAATGALDIAREFGDSICGALTIELCSWVTAQRADAVESARLHGIAKATWELIGTTMHAFGPHMDADSTSCARLSTRALGEQRFAEIVADQRPRSTREAIASALRIKSQERPVDLGFASLSRREEEIANYVARGLSNRAIAATLVISVRTVEGHVARILSKLGLQSRAEVAMRSSHGDLVRDPGGQLRA